VQGRIEDGTLFPNVSFMLETHLNQLAEEVLNEAEKYFDEFLDFVRSDLEMILDAESDPVEIENEAALEQFDGLLGVLKARHDEVLKRVQSIT
jgi:hypothetical protein